MDLNQNQLFFQFDPENILARIDGLPKQLESAWLFGERLPLPPADGIRQVIYCGLDNHSISGDLFAGYISSLCCIPFCSHRDVRLPAWGKGRNTLVILSSLMDNNKLSSDIYKNALQNNCSLLIITTNENLVEENDRDKILCWKFDHEDCLGNRTGFSFGLLLALFARLGWLPDPVEDLSLTIQSIIQQQITLRADIPIVKNAAKRMAGQFVERWVNIIGVDFLAPVARYWKEQINRIARAAAGYERISPPGLGIGHGLLYPEVELTHFMTIFLKSSFNIPDNIHLLDNTRLIYMQGGINTDVYNGSGPVALSDLWTTLHFGDYVAYYLAMIYDIHLESHELGFPHNLNTDIFG